MPEINKTSNGHVLTWLGAFVGACQVRVEVGWIFVDLFY